MNTLTVRVHTVRANGGQILYYLTFITVQRRLNLGRFRNRKPIHLVIAAKWVNTISLSLNTIFEKKRENIHNEEPKPGKA
jgi:hypothetical protein